jgi:hypothetical protein
LYDWVACQVDGSLRGTSTHLVGLLGGMLLRLPEASDLKKCQSGAAGGPPDSS